MSDLVNKESVGLFIMFCYFSFNSVIEQHKFFTNHNKIILIHEWNRYKSLLNIVSKRMSCGLVEEPMTNANTELFE